MAKTENILKYGSKRMPVDYRNSRSKRAGDGVSWSKKRLRHQLRRCLKKANDETGAICSGIYWI